MQDPSAPPPEKCCDLVMKGGITSGVVYPMAVVELSREYRFQCIGGTSAGAIAAVVTAAAEYGRATGGFERLARLPDELSRGLLEKFQPTPRMRPLFGLTLAALSGRPGRVLAALMRHYSSAALPGAFPGLVVMIAGGYIGGSWGFAALGLLLVILGALAAAGLAALRQVTRDLPAQDFGMCPGLTQPGAEGEALTDWLTRTIDAVAGVEPDKGPLTIAQLQAQDITVQTVTTDLSSRRPYALPMQRNSYAFSRREFLRLFPARIVDHMTRASAKVRENWGDPEGDLYYFRSEDLPVVVLARMSLSFPGLISAVPLHRIDYTMATPTRRRCLFSDGGISSNFPVHFFDEFLPHTPTFGISLADRDPRRIRPGDANEGRISLPLRANDGRQLPTRDIGGVLSFVMAMFDTAKDWQDSMQSILPGYRERIVTVALDPDEGGLNLDMPPERIRLLADLGGRAGREVLDKFDLGEHRWRRYLVEVRALDEALRQFARNYDSDDAQPGTLPYAQMAVEAGPKSFRELSDAQRAQLQARAETIAAAGRALQSKPPIEGFERRMPRSRAAVRNVARMDY